MSISSVTCAPWTLKGTVLIKRAHDTTAGRVLTAQASPGASWLSLLPTWCVSWVPKLLKAPSHSVSSLSQTLLPPHPHTPPQATKKLGKNFPSPTKLQFLTNVPFLLSLAHDCLSQFARCHYRCSLSLQDQNPSVIFIIFTIIVMYLFVCVCN